MAQNVFLLLHGITNEMTDTIAITIWLGISYLQVPIKYGECTSSVYMPWSDHPRERNTTGIL